MTKMVFDHIITWKTVKVQISNIKIEFWYSKSCILKGDVDIENLIFGIISGAKEEFWP